MFYGNNAIHESHTISCAAENNLKNRIIESNIIDNITRKYRTTLCLTNIILKNAGIDIIDDLTNFKNIDRELIISEKNNTQFDEFLPKIFEVFGKRECQFNQKEHTKHYILTVLKNMCKQITLDLTKKYKNVQKNGFVTSYVLYSIVYK